MTGRGKDGRYYFRVDVGFWDNPKAVAAGRDGRDLFLAALAWTRGQLQDGRIPATMLPSLAFRVGMPVDDGQAAADRLVEVGMWERTADGWLAHDYAEHQMTSAEIEAQRQKWRDKKAGQRSTVSPGDTPESPPDVQPPESESESESESETPSSSSARAPEPQTEPVDDDDDRIAAAITELGQHDHRQAKADGVTIRNPVKHLAACIEGRARDRPDLRRLARQHPEWTATQLAQRIRDPVTVPSICPDCNRVGGHHASTCPTRGDP